jgi:hypothetical protein
MTFDLEQERFDGRQIRLLHESKNLPRKLRLPENVEAELSKKHVISCAEVRGLIDRFGLDEAKLETAIRRIMQTRVRGK